MSSERMLTHLSTQVRTGVVVGFVVVVVLFVCFVVVIVLFVV